MCKAFDTVNHHCLWNRLYDIGVRGTFYFALKALYEDVISVVRVNGLYTDPFNIAQGVKQGCVLSPLLFSIYINDLALNIKSLNLGVDVENINLSILLFADDIALISDSPQNLQQMLHKVSEWCAKWRLSINEEKTKVIHFRPKACIRTDFRFMCLGKPVEAVDSYKYLGLLLNEHLDMQKIAQAISKSAHRALGVLIAKHKAFGGMPHAVFTKLYDNLVAPVIEYAAALWGVREYSCIGTVQNRACRFFMGCSKFTPNTAVRGEMG